MIGRTLLHYTIIEKLGEGGMGEVYKARDSHLDRFVAIKVLPRERFDEESKSRFIQEAKAASALNHPNIVAVYDIASEDDVTFIAMEYVPGKTLEELIPHGGLPLRKALGYASQIAAGLARAHRGGIVHRDLKPANVIVGDDGRVRLLDFGLAKLTGYSGTGIEEGATATRGHDTEEGRILGTVAYMSPEQAEGRSVDSRTDVFSFGVVLYEMLSGRRPFVGASRLETLSAILKETPPSLETAVDGLPRPLVRLVDRCLHKEPDRRWQHLDDAILVLEDAREDLDSGVSAGPAASATRERHGRLVAAALAGAALVGVVWMLLERDRSETAPSAAALYEPQVVPLTSYPGDERDPTFSPDGNQIAFSWGPEGGVTNTYMKLIGPGDPIRLTNSRYRERMSQWSPDGRFIAFLRGENRAVIAIPALGGPEREVASRTRWGGVHWSPDSTGLLAADGQPPSLYFYPLAGGEPRLVVGPLDGRGVYGGSIAPDGKSMAVSCGTGGAVGRSPGRWMGRRRRAASRDPRELARRELGLDAR